MQAQAPSPQLQQDIARLEKEIELYSQEKLCYEAQILRVFRFVVSLTWNLFLYLLKYVHNLYYDNKGLIFEEWYFIDVISIFASGLKSRMFHLLIWKLRFTLLFYHAYASQSNDSNLHSHYEVYYLLLIISFISC